MALGRMQPRGHEKLNCQLCENETADTLGSFNSTVPKRKQLTAVVSEGT